MPGIGDYTAAAIAAIAFDRPAVPVDGNVERVVSRLFAVEQELPAAKPLIKEFARSLLPRRRAGDFAQALMDLGATLCTPKRPACALLPVERLMSGGRARRCQETFPRKAPKREGQLRRGAAFVALRADGRVLLRRRPDKGLLAAMTEVPGSDWTHAFDAAPALRAAPRFKTKAGWRKLTGVVKHVFTHFPLELTVFVAQVPRTAAAPKGARWVSRAELAGEALPNVMRKVLAMRSTMRNAMPEPWAPDWAPSLRYPDPLVHSLDKRFDKYRLPLASVERLFTGSRWGEGPVWFGDGRYLLWSDVPGDRIRRWDEETGAVSVFRKPSNNANGNTRDRQGRLITCEHLSRRVTRTEYDGAHHRDLRPLRGQAAQFAERRGGEIRRLDLVHRSALRHPEQSTKARSPSRNCR